MPSALKNPTQRNISSILKWATGALNASRIESPRLTSEILLAHALNLRRIDLYTRGDAPIDDQARELFHSFVERRIRHEPVAYITGVQEFWSLPLSVTPHVLIPRPETECLVTIALKLMDQSESQGPLRILDLGAGAGPIVLAIAHERPGNVYFACDRSPEAIAVSRKNAKNLKLENRIRFFQGDFLTPLKQTSAPLDLIVSNPPYIATDVLPTLQPDVSVYEPRLALDGGVDGLSAIREILHASPDHLIPGGHLLVEIGYDQKAMCNELALNIPGMEPPVFFKDDIGHDRVLHLRKKQ